MPRQTVGMSGPLATSEDLAEPGAGDAGPPEVEIGDDVEATVGAFKVRRALPRRGRRTVGAWCFADHIGPAPVTEASGLDIGPHPHMGLQTVTWLVAGEALHRDSLGSEQTIKAGQLNLMTAGAGVSHSEEANGVYRGPLHGVQLWIAQPAETRGGPPAFEHHHELPLVEFAGTVATVLVGELAGERSPARHDTALVGADLSVAAGATTVELRASFEHALMALDAEVIVEGRVLGPGRLGYLGLGREEVLLEAPGPARVLLLGGDPFPEKVAMWWNFVARSRDELDAAYRDWRDGAERFGRVASALQPIAAPEPYWLRS